ncbi:PulJ/GspJ family protein [Schlesneria sp.]|uniref:PulJ/GspJ family protein n=1 Tax=Schlesneria sp. TaxID=2762018 RepID=UPI002EDDA685
MTRNSNIRNPALKRSRSVRSSQPIAGDRTARGFTLVEMLIAVGLILLIMSMFATIFEIAAGSLSKQRGLAENDQKARMLTSVIRGDLEKRTFRDIIPFTPGQDTGALGGLLLRRSGYWYYAENDPTDETDDVLQFTTKVTLKSQNSDTAPFLGVAVPFSGATRTIASQDDSGLQGIFTITGNVTGYFPSGAPFGHIWVSGSRSSNGLQSNDGRYRVTNISLPGGNTQIEVDRPILPMSTLGTIYLAEDQPELDDGIAGNMMGQSGAAEISYFLRGGNLYRRVLLIRDTDPSDSQPRANNGGPLISTGNPDYTSEYLPSGGSFWRDLDYSAFNFRGNSTGTNLIGGGVRFHNVGESLSNDANGPKEVAFSTPLPLPTPLQPQDQFRILSLGIPQTRFGHDPWTGLPREFAMAGTDGQLGTADDTGFIGRYTTSECSDSAFYYPGAMTTIPDRQNPALDTNPMSMNTPVTLDLNGAVTNYSSSPIQRRGTDILMANALSFDVKVWDPAANGGYGQFVDLGDNTITGGSFIPGNSQNFYYSPSTAGNGKYRYDTWHPRAEIAQPGSPANRNSNPPFATAVSAVQITINYRDIASEQIRQVTIVQSLVDPY